MHTLRLLLLSLAVASALQPTSYRVRTSAHIASRQSSVVAVSSWYDDGLRLTSEEETSAAQELPKPTDDALAKAEAAARIRSKYPQFFTSEPVATPDPVDEPALELGAADQALKLTQLKEEGERVLQRRQDMSAALAAWEAKEQLELKTAIQAETMAVPSLKVDSVDQALKLAQLKEEGERVVQRREETAIALVAALETIRLEAEEPMAAAIEAAEAEMEPTAEPAMSTAAIAPEPSPPAPPLQQRSPPASVPIASPLSTPSPPLRPPLPRPPASAAPVPTTVAAAATVGSNLLDFAKATGKMGISFSSAVVDESKVADIGSPTKDAVEAVKELGGLVGKSEFEKILPKLGVFGAAVGEALKRLGGSFGAATKDASTKERWREATVSGTKVADSFAVFVKAVSQQALPPAES